MNRERLVVVAIWVVFLLEAIHGGASIPGWNMGGGGAHLSTGTKLVMIGFPVAFFSLVVGFGSSRPSRAWQFRLVRYAVNKILSPGAYERIADDLHAELLGMCFLVGAGSIGAISCLVSGAPEFNLYFSLFALSGGVGFLIGWVILRLRKKTS